jgi:hypothetical protein
MADLTFKITAQSETSARTMVQARNFSIIVDEPQELGGSNQAANPVLFQFVTSTSSSCFFFL